MTSFRVNPAFRLPYLIIAELLERRLTYVPGRTDKRKSLPVISSQMKE